MVAALGSGITQEQLDSCVDKLKAVNRAEFSEHIQLTCIIAVTFMLWRMSEDSYAEFAGAPVSALYAQAGTPGYWLIVQGALLVLACVCTGYLLLARAVIQAIYSRMRRHAVSVLSSTPLIAEVDRPAD